MTMHDISHHIICLHEDGDCDYGDGDVGDNDVAADDDDDDGGGGFNFVAFKCELGEVRGGGEQLNWRQFGQIEQFNRSPSVTLVSN